LRSDDRLVRIDSCRYLLCFPVALLHALPGTAGHTTATWATLVASGCGVAVPFFFIASGYFMRVPAVWTPRIVTRPLVRLLPIYVAWFLIYAGIDALFHGPGTGPTVRGLLTGGTAFHLWFIPVLGMTLAAVPTGLVLAGGRTTVAAAVVLAALGLILGAYHEVLHLPGLGGIRLTMAPALVLIGYGFARSGFRIGLVPAVCAVAIGLLLVMAEEALIARLSGGVFTSHDIVLTTYPLGAAMFLLARGLDGIAVPGMLARLGAISLGVYASHLIFVRMFDPWIGRYDAIGAVALAAAAILAATLLSLMLDRLPLVRRLVR
jgi:surface polysaccharide O-acyltransferase-like enzyme